MDGNKNRDSAKSANNLYLAEIDKNNISEISEPKPNSDDELVIDMREGTIIKSMSNAPSDDKNETTSSHADQAKEEEIVIDLTDAPQLQVVTKVETEGSNTTATYQADMFEKEEPVKKIQGRTWKRVPTVFQMEATECGAACLGMILKYYGASIPLEKLRIDCGVSRDGSSSSNVVAAAKKYHLKSEYKPMTLKELLETDSPCIIHWNFNHFVVFEGVKWGHAYINDPGEGRRKINLSELDESFTGYTMVFEPNKNFKKSKGTKSIVYFAFNRLKKDKSTLITLIILGLLIMFVGLVAASFSKLFIDKYFGYHDTWGFTTLLLAMILTLIFQLFFNVIRGIIVNRLQAKLTLVSGYQLLSKMLKLPMNFFEQRYAGDLSQRIINNDKANSFLSGRLTGAFLDIFTAVLYLIVMLTYNITLTTWSVLGAIVCLLISKILSSKVKDLTIKYTQDTGKLYGVLFSGMEISKTLKASGVESKYASKVIGNYSKVSYNEQKIGAVQQILNTVPNYITQIVSVIIIIVGANLVMQHYLSAGSLVAFCAFLTLFLTPINNLFSLFQQIQELKASILRVEDIENQKIDERYKMANYVALKHDKLTGRININDLTFAYSKHQKPFIDNFNLSIEPSDVVALVGATGCGKTTIAKLISGLIPKWDGEILYDGYDISQIDPDVFSVSVAYISQDISIFEGTIKDNLTMWNDFALDKDIVQATKDACIHDTITKLPKTYDFKLKEDASNFSGGQKQRLEIARALVYNPSILIMDEATSALDTIVEQKIMKNLKRRGCTSIIVAHRLSTIRDADKIICIDNGKIVDVGKHEELIKRDGIYKRLIAND